MNGGEWRQCVFGVILFVGLASASPAQSSQEKIDLGRGDRVAKINLERLLLDDPRGIQEPLFQSRLEQFFASASRSDFFTQPDSSGTCDSSFREAFRCIELNNAQAGYIVTRVTNDECRFPYFYPLNDKTRALYVYFDNRNYQYWVRVPDPERIYGPFYGEPAERIRNAVIPYKQRRSFPGFLGQFLSRRWEFPDERDAMSDRKSDHYDFIGGRISGREEEAIRLNSAFLKFRLTNNSSEHLFIQYRNGRPYVQYLGRFAGEKNWGVPSWQDIDGPNFYIGQQVSWETLPRGSAFEFETKHGCQKPMLCAIRLWVNDERGSWDPVAVDIQYPGYAKRVFSRKHRPPQR
ncbi:MAG TPA: hypothetical protein VFZ49_04565 [Pyrinomonadaceae bacterium]